MDFGRAAFGSTLAIAVQTAFGLDSLLFDGGSTEGSLPAWWRMRTAAALGAQIHLLRALEHALAFFIVGTTLLVLSAGLRASRSHVLPPSAMPGAALGAIFGDVEALEPEGVTHTFDFWAGPPVGSLDLFFAGVFALTVTAEDFTADLAFGTAVANGPVGLVLLGK